MKSLMLLIPISIINIYIIYIVAYVVPREIKRCNESIDLLRQQVKEVSHKLNNINEKLD